MPTPPIRHRTTLLAIVASLTLACGGGGSETSSAQAAGVQTFSLSGTIPASLGTAIDGDTNDPSAVYVANDLPSEAQELPNPVMLGGYANAPGSGSSGRSFTSGDARDYYRVALAAGQSVRLFLAEDGATNDLDLALLALDETLIAARDGTERVMEIEIATSGVYLIEVSALSGASNYVLSIAQSTATSVRSEPDFVPGEIIVRFEEGSEAMSNMLPMQVLDATEDGAALMSCSDPDERAAAFQQLGIEHLAVPENATANPESRLRHDTRRIAKALARQHGVQAASLNYRREPHAVPADALYGFQYHLPQIGLPVAWDNVLGVPAIERSPEPIVVAVIDTGVVASHPDLQGQIVDGYDFIQDAASARDANGCDSNPEDLGDGILPANSSFHGTHVAGTIAARTSLQTGGDADGVAGVAFDAKIMPLRVLGVNGGTDFDIMQAVRYAAGMTNDCGVLPSAPADVINMSLGGAGFNAAFQALINDVRAAGLTVVASAGNSQSSAPNFPAAFEGVIAVSAVDANDELAPYSNFGASIDVAAPGGDLTQDANNDGFSDGVLSTWVDPSNGELIYGFAQGTSMAAPHVAGVIALMLDVNPALTPFDIDALLADGSMTKDIGPSNSFGAGRIDAFAAIIAAIDAQGGTPPANNPRLAATPAPLNFGALANSLDLELANVGGDDAALVINSLTVAPVAAQAWLNVAERSVDTNGVGIWRVTLDRSALGPDTIYTATLQIDSTANDVDVEVLVHTTDTGTTTDAGHHFVLLVDPETLTTVAELQVDIGNSGYAYRFDGVEAGEYLIVAGSDSDNDNIICDTGEACGAYPARDQLAPFLVDRNRFGTDFQTGFSTSFEAEAVGPATAGGFARGAGKSLPR